MSRAPISTTQAAIGHAQARADFTRLLLKHGQSFSGREKNCCYLNTGGGKFADISAVSGFDFPDDGRGLAKIDWDHDGDLDAWVSNRNAPRLRFLRNDTSHDHHYLALRLVGNGATTNRDAIGARVEVVLGNQEPEAATQGGLRRIQTLRAGEGFLAQSTKWVHFGLGPATNIERVVVHWPGGESEIFVGLEVDQRYKIVQGSGVAEGVASEPRALALTPSPPEIPPPDSKARIPLIALLNVPRLSYETAQGERRELPIGQDKPLLLNLWASWCRPCLAELAEITEREEDLRKAGINVLALSVDGLGKDASDPAATEEILQELKFPFPSGRAKAELFEMLQAMHDRLIAMHPQLPVPTSLLIDSSGRLTVIYKGAVSVDQLLEDVSHSAQPLLDRFAAAAYLPGRVIRHEVIEEDLLAAEWNTRLLFGMALQERSRLADAEKQFVEILKVAPNVAEVYTNLGNVVFEQGRHADALKQWERALELKPDQADAHNSLGVLFTVRGLPQRARRHYELAIDARPDYLEAQNNLAWLLATCSDANVRDGPRALELAKRAVEQTEYGQAGTLDTLAAAYAANAQFDQAVQWQKKAVELAQGKMKAELAARLELYQQGRPYLESPSRLVQPSEKKDS